MSVDTLLLLESLFSLYYLNTMQLGLAVYRDQNSLAMDFLMEQFEVLHSDALPDNNQQRRYYWNLSDNRLVQD